MELESPLIGKENAVRDGGGPSSIMMSSTEASLCERLSRVEQFEKSEKFLTSLPEESINMLENE